MSLKLTRNVACGTAASVAAILALSFSTAPQAQPDPDQPSYDNSSSVDSITVYAPRRERRAPDGSQIVHAQALRVVDISDLDLSTGWGQHVMRERISRAATAACRELDMQWTQGLYPMPEANDADCYRQAVNNALASAPTAVAENDYDVSNY
jgi:UrcA family protein